MGDEFGFDEDDYDAEVDVETDPDDHASEPLPIPITTSTTNPPIHPPPHPPPAASTGDDLGLADADADELFAEEDEGAAAPTAAKPAIPHSTSSAHEYESTFSDAEQEGVHIEQSHKTMTAGSAPLTSSSPPSARTQPSARALSVASAHDDATVDDYAEAAEEDGAGVQQPVDAAAEDDYVANARPPAAASDASADEFPADDEYEDVDEEEVITVAPPAAAAAPSLPLSQRSYREEPVPSARTSDRSVKSARRIPQPPLQHSQRSQPSHREATEEEEEDQVEAEEEKEEMEEEEDYADDAEDAPSEPPHPTFHSSLAPSHPSSMPSTHPTHLHKPSASAFHDDIPDHSHSDEPPPPPVDEDLPPPSSPSHSRHPSVAVGQMPVHRAPPKPIDRTVHAEVEEEDQPYEPDQPIDEDVHHPLPHHPKSAAKKPTPRVRPAVSPKSAKGGHRSSRIAAAKQWDGEGGEHSTAEGALSDHVHALEHEVRVLQSRVRTLSTTAKPPRRSPRASVAAMAPFLDYSNRISELERELQSEKKERKTAEQTVKRLEKECMQQSQQQDRLPTLLQQMSEEMTRERAAARKARELRLQAEVEVRRLTARCLDLEKKLGAQERRLDEHRERMGQTEGGGTRDEREEEGRLQEALHQQRKEMQSLHAEISRHKDTVARHRPSPPPARPLPPWGSHPSAAKPKPAMVRASLPRQKTRPPFTKLKDGKRVGSKPAPQSQPLPSLDRLRAEVKAKAAAVAKAQKALDGEQAGGQRRAGKSRLPVVPAPLIPRQVEGYPTSIPQLRNPAQHQPHPLPTSTSPSRLPVLKGGGKGTKKMDVEEREHAETMRKMGESMHSSKERPKWAEVEETKEMDLQNVGRGTAIAKVSARSEVVEDEVDGVADDAYEDEGFD